MRPTGEPTLVKEILARWLAELQERRYCLNAGEIGFWLLEK